MALEMVLRRMKVETVTFKCQSSAVCLSLLCGA
jgi:hypothetical protein